MQRYGLLLLAWLWPLPVFAAADIAVSDVEKPPEYNTIVLQGLNKVTGHISKIEGPLGTALRFGNIEIVAKRCWKSPPEEQPENAALLDILEFKPGEGSGRIFQGWMFSSSPGLSGLEHAVYDVTVIACEERADPEKLDESVETPKQEPPKPETKKEKPKPQKKK